MKITIESTETTALVGHDGYLAEARRWEGETDKGTKVVAYVLCIEGTDVAQEYKLIKELPAYMTLKPTRVHESKKK